MTETASPKSAGSSRQSFENVRRAFVVFLKIPTFVWSAFWGWPWSCFSYLRRGGLEVGPPVQRRPGNARLSGVIAGGIITVRSWPIAPADRRSAGRRPYLPRLRSVAAPQGQSVYFASSSAWRSTR